MDIPHTGRTIVTILTITGALMISAVAIARTRLLNLAKIKLKDSVLNNVQLTDSAGNAYFVFVFLSPECPLSQQYTLELNALAKDYHARFYGVVPGSFYDTSVINDFKRKYHISFPLLLDPILQLTRSLGASVTPQAVVVERNNILYSGAIDNAYLALGKKQATTTAFYLKDALLAIQKKESVKIKKTNAVGCLIEFNPTYSTN